MFQGGEVLGMLLNITASGEVKLMKPTTVFS